MKKKELEAYIKPYITESNGQKKLSLHIVDKIMEDDKFSIDIDSLFAFFNQKNIVIEEEPVLKNDYKGINKDDYLSSGFDEYLKLIGSFPLLTHEEEIYYSNLSKTGNKAAFDMLINSNLRLVVFIAKRYTGKGLDIDDLVQEGNLGLQKAACKFDSSKGYRFSTYASWWVRQAIVRAVIEKGRTVRVPVHREEKFNKLKSINTKYMMLHKRNMPSMELVITYFSEGKNLSDLASRLKVSEKKTLKLMKELLENEEEDTFPSIASKCHVSDKKVILLNNILKNEEAMMQRLLNMSDIVSINKPILGLDDDSGAEMGDFIEDNNLTENLVEEKEMYPFLCDFIENKYLEDAKNYTKEERNVISKFGKMVSRLDFLESEYQKELVSLLQTHAFTRDIFSSIQDFLEEIITSNDLVDSSFFQEIEEKKETDKKLYRDYIKKKDSLRIKYDSLKSKVPIDEVNEKMNSITYSHMVLSCFSRIREDYNREVTKLFRKKSFSDKDIENILCQLNKRIGSCGIDNLDYKHLEKVDMIVVKKDYVNRLVLLLQKEYSIKSDELFSIIRFYKCSQFGNQIISLAECTASIEQNKVKYKEIFSSLRKVDITCKRISGAFTLDAIGKQYSITRERVRQIENSIIREVRPILKNEMLEFNNSGNYQVDKKNVLKMYQ